MDLPISTNHKVQCLLKNQYMGILVSEPSDYVRLMLRQINSNISPVRNIEHLKQLFENNLMEYDALYYDTFGNIDTSNPKTDVFPELYYRPLDLSFKTTVIKTKELFIDGTITIPRLVYLNDHAFSMLMECAGSNHFVGIKVYNHIIRLITYLITVCIYAYRLAKEEVGNDIGILLSHYSYSDVDDFLQMLHDLFLKTLPENTY